MNFLGSKEQMKASRGLNGLASQKVFIALHFVLFVGKQSFQFSLKLRRLLDGRKFDKQKRRKAVDYSSLEFLEVVVFHTLLLVNLKFFLS